VHAVVPCLLFAGRWELGDRGLEAVNESATASSRIGRE
jgi:hypothetical protein